MRKLSYLIMLMSFISVASMTGCSEAETDTAAQTKTRKSYVNMPTNWWAEIGKKSPTWYRSEEGLNMAENILSWQDEHGGWPLMNTTLENFTGDVSRAGPWGTTGGLAKATYNEIRFLGRGYTATEDERYLVALTKGLNFILEAQYDNGGWPHSYPHLKTDYSHNATFNDDLMADAMTLLSEVSSHYYEFKFINGTLRKRARAAVKKGVDFILKSQIIVDGKRTAWPQQVDEVTLQPVPARAFEPAAISGGESASIINYLMSIDKPNAELINVIESAVQWYRDVGIDGYELTRVEGDRILKPNADAPTLWARFYEIGTNRPIFAGRDGVIKYDMSEVELERRRGYSWYNRSGDNVFAQYKLWKYSLPWATQEATNIDEEKVKPYVLPNPLKLESGDIVKTVEQWEQQRRPEILELFEQHQHGVTPSKSIAIRFEIIEQDKPGLSGKAIRTQARIHFPDHPGSPVIRVLLYTPAKATGPVPTLLYLSFSPNVLSVSESGIDEGMAWSGAVRGQIPDRDANLVVSKFDAETFVDNGFGVAVVYYGDIAPDFDHNEEYGVRTLFDTNAEPREATEWGTIGQWAWGLSRVMDYLQTQERVDDKKVALSGMSRLGKATIWAGAQDERFALVMPLMSGEGGAAISQRNYGEAVADLTNPRRYDFWYSPRYADYAFDLEALPVDGHMLVSLIAPRPILQIVGTGDTWSDPYGEWESAQAASPVYELYGLSNMKNQSYPKPDTGITGDMSFFLHEGSHTILPIDFQKMNEFMHEHFDSK